MHFQSLACDYHLSSVKIMGIDTQHQHSHSTSSSTPDGEEVHHQSIDDQSQDGEKPDHEGQMANDDDMEGEHVDSENVSVVQGKKKISVPVWRLVRASHCC